MKKIIALFRKRGFASFLASFVSIIIGLIFGYFLLLSFDSQNALYGIKQILFAGVSSPAKIAKVLYQAAPLILTGLSVGFAFKTGLFNIGASGQYLTGACFALYAGIVLQQPWYVALVASVLGGAIWGSIPGLCKALFNVNEVITSIMFNWIGLFAVNVLIVNTPKILANYWGSANTDRTANLSAANADAIIPALGLDKMLKSPFMNTSIFIAAAVAIIAFIILEKTTFGYGLKACGFNKNASIYAGINAKRNTILSMTIAGGFAGLGGGIYFLSGTVQYTVEKLLMGMGFNGIPVALLAQSNPVATIFSAAFISYIQVGGDAMQPEFAKEMIDIIISVIIYLSAFSLLLKGLITRLLNQKKKAAHPVQVPPAETDEKKEAAK